MGRLYSVGWLVFWTIIAFPIAIIHLFIILGRIQRELEVNLIFEELEDEQENKIRKGK